MVAFNDLVPALILNVSRPPRCFPRQISSTDNKVAYSTDSSKTLLHDVALPHHPLI